MTSADPGIILLAHGSPDPRHRLGVEALAAGMRRLGGPEARIGYLDHHGPTVATTAVGLARGVVVPVLLTRAYHARTDIPAAIAGLGPGFVAADPLGPDPRLAYAIAELLSRAGCRPDAETAVIVYVPGSSDRAAVAAVGSALAGGIPDQHWGPWLVAALDGGDPLDLVVRRLAGRPAIVVPYMVAEGILRDRMVERGHVERAAGRPVEVIAGTLGQTEMLARIAIQRATAKCL